MDPVRGCSGHSHAAGDRVRIEIDDGDRSGENGAWNFPARIQCSEFCTGLNRGWFRWGKCRGYCRFVSCRLIWSDPDGKIEVRVILKQKGLKIWTSKNDLRWWNYWHLKFHGDWGLYSWNSKFILFINELFEKDCKEWFMNVVAISAIQNLTLNYMWSKWFIDKRISRD